MIIEKLSRRRLLYKGDRIDLMLVKELTAVQAYDHVPAVFFEIIKDERVIGDIELYLTFDENDPYYGQVGYEIASRYRGFGYAAEALRMVLEIAYSERKMKSLVLTCNPDNIPSYRTIEKCGGKYRETVLIPYSHELYFRGDRKKCIFDFDLEEIYGEN